ncbi:MAG: hypothetical protein ACRBBP_06610 [Bdellovibrionales bacterium]
MYSREAGQALIESIAVLSFTGILFIGISSAAYSIYAKQAAGFSMQKSLLCLERVNVKPHTCKRAFKAQINNFLFLNKNLSLSLKRLSSSNKASISFVFMKKKFNWSKKLVKNKESY